MLLTNSVLLVSSTEWTLLGQFISDVTPLSCMEIGAVRLAPSRLIAQPDYSSLLWICNFCPRRKAWILTISLAFRASPMAACIRTSLERYTCGFLLVASEPTSVPSSGWLVAGPNEASVNGTSSAIKMRGMKYELDMLFSGGMGERVNKPTEST